MFNLGSKSAALRGSGHLVLNVIRACNVITLLAIAVVSWILIIMPAIRRSFFFFDAASHLFTSLFAVALILSELSLLKTYFRRNWPVLSQEHGFTWLGAAMVIMGCHVLATLNEPAVQPSRIGRPIHSLVLATGILGLTFGAANVAASLLFADREARINARMIRSDGNLASSPPSRDDDCRSQHTGSSDSALRSHYQEKTASSSSNPNRWTKRFTFTGGRRLKISRPIPHDEDEPVPVPPPPFAPSLTQHHVDVESQYHPAGDWRDSRSSPIIPLVKRPDTALHPMHTGVSRYSEVSHLPRF